MFCESSYLLMDCLVSNFGKNLQKTLSKTYLCSYIESKKSCPFLTLLGHTLPPNLAETVLLTRYVGELLLSLENSAHRFC